MLRVGLVGCGFMGRMHTSVYSQIEDATLVGVFDADLTRGKEFANANGVAFFESFEALAAAVDAIDICLPTYMHCEYTLKAAALKKHVLCEKPMALNVADAIKMKEACEAADVRLMIAHCIRFWPEYALLKQIALTGNIGELLSLNLTRYGEFPHWGSNNWLADPSKAGGGALDMHIHDTDFALYLLGKPKEIFSAGTVDAKGVSHIFSTFVYDRAICHLEGGWNMPPGTPFKMAFRAVFEQGAIIMDGCPMTIYERGKEPYTPEFPKMEAKGGGNISDLGGYYHEIAHFVERVLNGKPFDVSTPETSIESLQITLHEIDSARARAKPL
jgi:UDP-N-acetylglucosamine 3-dehydrogenase